VLVVRLVEDQGALEGAWRELFADSPSATPFQTYDWQATWWRHYGAGKKPYLVAVEEGRDLVGLMPMARFSGAWRTLRSAGAGPSDYLHPLARDGHETAVAEAVGGYLREMRGFDLLDLHQVRESLPFASAAPGDSFDQAACLVLDLPRSYDEYLAMLGKSLRYDVRKLDKTLFKEGKATVQQVTPDEVGLGMDILFEQHRMRWRKRGLPGAFLGKAVRFHKEWADRAVREGWLWLSILRLEGQPIGAIYAMSAHETCYFYQAGFDPSHGSISPGTLLVASTIRRAIEEGKAHFDFMRGDEPYKRRWKPQHALANRRIVLARPGLRGEVGLSWNLAGSKVERRVRERLEGKGLF
jgi:CelD/BcsL family acetyltransferase involved in cellulose biosynthesis